MTSEHKFNPKSCSDRLLLLLFFYCAAAMLEVGCMCRWIPIFQNVLALDLVEDLSTWIFRF